MDLTDFNQIATAPLDGTPVFVACEQHPEFGVHVMEWSKRNNRWEGWAYATVRKVRTWWDEAQPQPTHWKHVV
ncbi:MAG: hypothetical protein E6R08_01190 [Nevskiaceae bacterium]|nr:MAG: hypothetical protein E6R08_01190 [Nevskiaceae bacterium]